MIFADPEYIWLLPVIIAVGFLSLRHEYRRKSALERFAEQQLADRLTLLPSFGLRITAVAALSAAMALLLLALLRPQWGLIQEEQTRKGLDLVIALDVSRSMLADDLRPSRLAVAKAAVNKLLDRLSGDRVGILAFSGTAFTVCPLTGDHAIVRRMIDELGPEILPRGGSSIAAAVKEAERSFRNSPPQGRVLILISDGEDHDGGIAAAVRQLQMKGVTVLAAFVGTEDGALIPEPGEGFVKDRSGAVIRSRGSLATIRSIDPEAITLNGDGAGLELLLQRSRAIATSTVRKERRQRLAERFQIPLAAALVLLVTLTVFSGRRKE
ncbi:hypothetical protein OR1_02306 [Geobacter sp. OR-1]|nr:hypothetical protein OR1_02306 [Geobacter sp. OR-1]